MLVTERHRQTMLLRNVDFQSRVQVGKSASIFFFHSNKIKKKIDQTEKFLESLSELPETIIAR